MLKIVNCTKHDVNVYNICDTHSNHHGMIKKNHGATPEKTIKPSPNCLSVRYGKNNFSTTVEGVPITTSVLLNAYVDTIPQELMNNETLLIVSHKFATAFCYRFGQQFPDIIDRFLIPDGLVNVYDEEKKTYVVVGCTRLSKFNVPILPSVLLARVNNGTIDKATLDISVQYWKMYFSSLDTYQQNSLQILMSIIY